MKRAANGQGSLIQLKDGRWRYRVSMGYDAMGKLIRKDFYGKTQAEALKKGQAALAQYNAGTYAEPSKMTLGEWLYTWHDEFVVNVKHTTEVRYRQDIDNHIVPALGKVKLSKLNPIMIQRFYNGLNLSPKTVKNIHGVLHQALKKAVRLGYIRSNPADDVELPRMEKAVIKPLDAPDVTALLGVLGDDVYSDIIYVAMFTGMRSGELLGLRWDSVDFEAGTICIDSQLVRPRVKGEAYTLGSPKNGKSRTIAPAGVVFDRLRDVKRKQAQNRLIAGQLWGGIPGLVFTYETGKQIDNAIVLRHFKKYLAMAELPESFRFHDLRHTYASLSLQAGDDYKTLQENLGHHHAAFTLDMYGHVTDTMRHNSAMRMGSYIKTLCNS